LQLRLIGAGGNFITYLYTGQAWLKLFRNFALTENSNSYKVTTGTEPAEPSDPDNQKKGHFK